MRHIIFVFLSVLSALAQPYQISPTGTTRANLREIWGVVNSNTTYFSANLGGGTAQTNISYTAVTNAPWQLGSANLTNWSGVTLFNTNGVTTAFVADDVTLSNALVTRIGATNTAIEGKGVGYTITLAGGWESGTLSDAATYFIGGDLFNSTRAGSTAYTNWSVEIPKAGTIRRVYLKVRLVTLGTSENVTNYIRLNDSSDVGQIDLSYNKIMVEGNNTSISQAVVAGDKVALKIACPTWATNPVGVRWYCIIYVY
jgi:hypothetical protein